MKLVTSIIKRCQAVIRQKGGYTQFKPEVADYCEPFRECFHQILKVYAPNTIFEKVTTIMALIVDVLLTLGIHGVFFEFCKIDGLILLAVCSP